MRLLPVLAAFAFGCTGFARADTFDFTFTPYPGFFAGDPTLVFTGTLTATNNGDGSYLVTALQGSNNIALLPPGGFLGNTNTLGSTDLPSYQPVIIDGYGLGFQALVSGLSYDFDLVNYYKPYGTYLITEMEPGVESEASTLVDLEAVTAPSGAPTTVTPEPSSIILLGTGLLATAALAMRRASARR